MALSSPTLIMASPAELLLGYLEQDLDQLLDFAKGGVVIGSAIPDKQKVGVVCLNESGVAETEIYTPQVRQRIEIQCIHPYNKESNLIAQYVFHRINGINRKVVRQGTSGNRHLIQSMIVDSGPAARRDEGSEFFNQVLFVNILIHLGVVRD